MSLNKDELKALLDDFRSKARIAKQNPSKSKKKSEQWILGQMQRIKSHRVSRPSIGKMYMFGYDAKHKDTLPYWDKFPLIVCLGVNAKYMLGLNLHYIPPKAREVFLEQLLKFASTTTITNKTKLKINWGRVKGMGGVQHMIKLYLASNVRFGIKEVAPKDWHNVIYLPTQQFVSKGRNISATRAYNDFHKSRRK